jgi:hypothetical protein
MSEFSIEDRDRIGLLARETAFSLNEIEDAWVFLKENGVSDNVLIAMNIKEMDSFCKNGLTFKQVLNKWSLRKEENLKEKIDNWKKGNIYLKIESLDRPQSLKILGCIVKIEYFKDAHRTDQQMGWCDSKVNKIHLNENMPEDVQHQTLLHEVIHKISDDLDIELTEKQVAALSVVLFGTLIDNPGILGRE